MAADKRSAWHTCLPLPVLRVLVCCEDVCADSLSVLATTALPTRLSRGRAAIRQAA